MVGGIATSVFTYFWKRVRHKVKQSCFHIRAGGFPTPWCSASTNPTFLALFFSQTHTLTNKHAHIHKQTRTHSRTFETPTDPNPTARPDVCAPADCDFCRQNSEPKKMNSRCPCPEQICVAAPTTAPGIPAPSEQCCEGSNPAGSLKKIRDHEKCNETRCVLGM